MTTYAAQLHSIFLPIPGVHGDQRGQAHVHDCAECGCVCMCAWRMFDVFVFVLLCAAIVCHRYIVFDFAEFNESNEYPVHLSYFPSP